MPDYIILEIRDFLGEAVPARSQNPPGAPEKAFDAGIADPFGGHRNKPGLKAVSAVTDDKRQTRLLLHFFKGFVDVRFVSECRNVRNQKKRRVNVSFGPVG